MQQATTLTASSRKLLLTLHIAATVGVLGADLVLLALGLAGFGGADPLTVYPAAHMVGASVVAPLALLSLGTGLLLALLSGWGLLRYWWVVIKLSITVILTAAVLFVLVPRLGAAAEAAGGAAAVPLSAAARLPLVVAPAVATTLLLLALVLAVFKPDWRVRSRTLEHPEGTGDAAALLVRQG